jgi:hypothetical protein
MLTTVKLWKVEEKRLASVKEASFAENHKEKDLEDWISEDPSLISNDLCIVGRQVYLPGVGALDLAAVTKDGTLCIIEFKRHKTTRDTIAQILHYSSAIKEMDSGELQSRLKLNKEEAEEIAGSDPLMMIVAAEASYEVERIAQLLAQKGVKIEVITFTYTKLTDGSELIARSVSVPSETSRARHIGERGLSKAPELSQILHVADDRAVRPLVDILRQITSPPFDWPESRYHANGGTLRYSIAAPPDARAKVVFGMNVGGRKLDSPRGVLDAWISPETAALYSETSVDSVWSDLKIFKEKVEKNRQLFIRIHEQSAAEQLLEILKKWDAGSAEHRVKLAAREIDDEETQNS